MDARRVAALLIVGCAAKPLEPPGREPMPAVFGQSERVATDGHQIAAADGTHLVVGKLDGRDEHTFAARGAPQQLVFGNDGTVFAGWGMDRVHRDARASIVAYHGTEEEVVLEPETSRAEIASLRFVHGHLLFAYFDSKYWVTLGAADPPHWQPRTLGRFRMASAVDELADGRVVVGRVYGDDINTDGDVFLLADHTVLPTTRGVRALIADRDDLFVADGWHREYAAKAKGLVTRIHDAKAQLVEDTAGQFVVWKLAFADLDGDGTPELIGGGNKYIRAWKRRGDRFAGTTIFDEPADFAAAPGLVVVGGPHGQLLRWKTR